MSSPSFNPIRWLLAFASRLRFPQLFLLTAAVFFLDLIIPDVIPFADEVLLGLLTTMLGSVRKKSSALPPDEKMNAGEKSDEAGKNDESGGPPA